VTPHLPCSPHSRRHFLGRSIAFSAGFVGLHAMFARSGQSLGVALAAAGDDGLVPDPEKILDLPPGFSYKVISRAGAPMSDGLVVPGRPDGMAAFQGENGLTLLVRNHELEASWVPLSAFGPGNRLLKNIDPEFIYDTGRGVRPSLGGTTTVVYDTAKERVVREFMSLAGTNRNCAGGPTPWGTWLTCEEDDVNEGKDDAEVRHGYVFEVVPTIEPKLSRPVPIKPMGRFMHEAVCVDPRTHIVYQTEDRADGLIYRFIPENRDNIHAGGRLQALALADAPSAKTGNRPKRTIEPGTKLAVRWIDLDEIDAPKDDLRHRGFAAGAAMFARGEGMWWGNGSAYFAATIGGAAQKGQLWRYTSSTAEGTDAERDEPGVLELFIEPNDGRVIENADNITVAPWGELFACEDGYEHVDARNRLLRISPEGTVRTFARNASSDGEFAGVCFSPDGSTMFVNLQIDNLTLAVRGPWRE